MGILYQKEFAFTIWEHKDNCYGKWGGQISTKFDKIIVYYDYGQMELAQILISVFNTMFSIVDFRKIETNQYKLSQAADLICTVEAIEQKNVLTKSEIEFFHSKNAFKKNIYKNIAKKKL